MFIVMCETYPEGVGFRTKKKAIKYAREYANSHPKTETSVYQITETKITRIGRVYGNPRNPNLLYVDDPSKMFGERPMKIETNGSISELWH